MLTLSMRAKMESSPLPLPLPPPPAPPPFRSNSGAPSSSLSLRCGAEPRLLLPLVAAVAGPARPSAVLQWYHTQLNMHMCMPPEVVVLRPPML